MVGETKRRAVALARLVTRLGPWAKSEVRAGVARQVYDVEAFDGRTIRCWAYGEQRRALGVFVIAPGLHPEGPADARLRRFATALSSAGFVVVTPFLEDHLRLVLAERAVDDLEAVVLDARSRFSHLAPPTLFSISFGSYPALGVASRLGDSIDGAIVFGGYADFGAVARFAVDGNASDGASEFHLPFDKTSLPAVFLNLSHHLGLGGDVEEFEDALRAVCKESWIRTSRSELRSVDALVEELAKTLPSRFREVFRVACARSSSDAFDGGARALVNAALEAGADEFARFDPRPLAPRITRPVFVVHGRDDDVVPFTEALALHRALSRGPRSKLLLTGLLTHSGNARVTPSQILKEAKTLLSLGKTIADGGRLRFG